MDYIKQQLIRFIKDQIRKVLREAANQQMRGNVLKVVVEPFPNELCNIVFGPFFQNKKPKKASIKKKEANKYELHVADLSEYFGEEWWKYKQLVPKTNLVNGTFEITTFITVLLLKDEPGMLTMKFKGNMFNAHNKIMF